MDKKQQVIELDTLFQQFAKESSCWFHSLLPKDVSPTQYFILKIINDHKKCKAADIAHILDVSPATTTNLVDKLCENGWIKRTRSEQDRRVVWLELTETGKGLFDEIESKRYDLLLGNFKNVTNEELLVLKQALLKILATFTVN